MSLLKVKTPLSFTPRESKILLIVTFAILATVGSLAGGCSGEKEAATTAPVAGQPPAAAQPGDVKLTAEQEAVRKRAMEQGPGVEAAAAKAAEAAQKDQ